MAARKIMSKRRFYSVKVVRTSGFLITSVLSLNQFLRLQSNGHISNRKKCPAVLLSSKYWRHVFNIHLPIFLDLSRNDRNETAKWTNQFSVHGDEPSFRQLSAVI
jgi:hypothetical protein